MALNPQSSMKTRQVPFPADSLAAKYLPADYADAVECVCSLPATVTPDDIQVGFWTAMPRWVAALMKLRNWLVRPFGLESGNGKTADEIAVLVLKGVTDRTETETVTAKDDKHLKFYCSVLLVREPGDGRTSVIVCTVVQIHNKLGKIYFSIIKPFHKVIVKSTLKNTLRQLQALL